jgi:hypothetical protein
MSAGVASSVFVRFSNKTQTDDFAADANRPAV